MLKISTAVMTIMKIFSALTSCLLLVILAMCKHVSSTLCPAAFTQEHHVLRNHVISSSSAQSIDQCKQQCASHMECHSINFYSSQNKCELNKATHLSSPVDLSYEILGTYEIYGQRPLNMCSDSLCSTNETCLLNNNNSKKKYICKGT
jgi:hypothetical protein